MTLRLPRNPIYAIAVLVLSGSIAFSQQAPTQPAAPASTAPASAPVERRPPPPNQMRNRNNMRPGMMQGRGNGPANFRGAAQVRNRGNFRGGPGGAGFHGSKQGAINNGGLRIAPEGMWWRNSSVVTRIGLTADQTKKMDGIFQDSRIQLIDLKANVDKQEIMLEPLLSANPLDTVKAQAQIDKVADARADLEKANAKMLLGIRAVLTADQWTKLNDRHAGAQPAAAAPNGQAAAGGSSSGRGRGQRRAGTPPNANNLIDPIDQM